MGLPDAGTIDRPDDVGGALVDAGGEVELESVAVGVGAGVGAVDRLGVGDELGVGVVDALDGDGDGDGVGFVAGDVDVDSPSGGPGSTAGRPGLPVAGRPAAGTVGTTSPATPLAYTASTCRTSFRYASESLYARIARTCPASVVRSPPAAHR